jgi:hypothetical protein
MTVQHRESFLHRRQAMLLVGRQFGEGHFASKLWLDPFDLL